MGSIFRHWPGNGHELLSGLSALGLLAAGFLVLVASGIGLVALLRGRRAVAALAAGSAVAAVGACTFGLLAMSLLAHQHPLSGGAWKHLVGLVPRGVPAVQAAPADPPAPAALELAAVPRPMVRICVVKVLEHADLDVLPGVCL
jgi:hypothetical protein